MTAEHVVLNGRLGPIGSAGISVCDHGLTVGDGVFETVRVDHGSAFAVRRHLERLARSAHRLGLHCPPADVLRQEIALLLDADRMRLGALARLRLTLTGGQGPLGSERRPGPGTRILAAAPSLPTVGAATLLLVDWRRPTRSALTGVKSTSYAENVIALAAARRAGATEALLLSDTGALCEGSGSNIVLDSRGRLRSPDLTSGCLPGITRELVCTWFDVDQCHLTLADLTRADEVAITSSLRGVQPVDRVLAADGTVIWQAAGVGPGSTMERLAREFRQHAAADRDP